MPIKRNKNGRKTNLKAGVFVSLDYPQAKPPPLSVTASGYEKC